MLQLSLQFCVSIVFCLIQNCCRWSQRSNEQVLFFFSSGVATSCSDAPELPDLHPNRTTIIVQLSRLFWEYRLYICFFVHSFVYAYIAHLFKDPHFMNENARKRTTKQYVERKWHTHTQRSSLFQAKLPCSHSHFNGTIYIYFILSALNFIDNASHWKYFYFKL